MRTYTQLTQEQRYQIYALKKMGHNQTAIAQCLGVDKATISRELRRNRGQRGYRPKQAHRLAQQRRRRAHYRITPGIWALVEHKLRQEWSPEQIAGWLQARCGIRLSHEWIYQYILADKRADGALYKHLRCQKKRRKRYGRSDRRGKLAHTVSIEHRPAIVAQRRRLGDWEVDTILGQGRRTAVVTLTERKSRLARLAKVERKTAELVGQAIQQTLGPLQDQVHTITADNGKEFGQHETIAAALEAEVYFAHPYAAWERGANENMNGLLRQYLPKTMDLATLSEQDLSFIMDRLNNRPRKSLGFRTPNEVFFQSSVALSS